MDDKTVLVNVLRKNFNILKNHAWVLFITEKINLFLFSQILICFFVVLFTIEPIFSEWILVRVCLVISMIVQAFECIQVWFIFLCFKSGRIDFVICLIAPSKLVVVFSFMWTTALDISRSLDPAWDSCVALPLTVLILGHTWVHICAFDGGDIVSYIKAPINKAFGLASTLNILYIHLNNGHVWFRWHFDNIQFVL